MASLTVNDIFCEILFNNHQIVLPVDHLREQNLVTIYFMRGDYCTDNTGLYRDMKKSDQFLATQFESAHCHKVFPCFD